MSFRRVLVVTLLAVGIAGSLAARCSCTCTDPSNPLHHTYEVGGCYLCDSEFCTANYDFLKCSRMYQKVECNGGGQAGWCHCLCKDPSGPTSRSYNVSDCSDCDRDFCTSNFAFLRCSSEYQQTWCGTH